MKTRANLAFSHLGIYVRDLARNNPHLALRQAPEPAWPAGMRPQHPWPSSCSTSA